MMCCALVLVSCGTKRKMAVGQETAAESAPMWHTCLIQNARATLSLGGNQISANVTMQTVRDSMLVISVMPLPGIEIARFEATPFELTGFNKLEGTYATTTYAELNRNLVPTINWDVLQQLCTAELPTGDKSARLVYTLGDKTVELSVIYPVRKLDVPVRVNKQNTGRYKKIDITKWLSQATYVVLLSDSEACSYTLNEALYRNIPIITTPLPYLEEIGVRDGENGYIMDFDCSNVDNIVENITKIPKFTFKRLDDKYGELFTKDKSHYDQDQNQLVQVQVLKTYHDIELNRVVESGEIIKEPMKLSRAEHLEFKGLVRIIANIKD